MSFHFCNAIAASSRSFTALVAGVAVIGLAAPTDASIQLAVSPDNTNYTTLTLTPVPMMAGQFSYTNTALSVGGVNFDVSFLLTTNSPGTPTSAELINVGTIVRQGGAGGGNRDFYVRVTDDTFTQPIGAKLALNSDLEILANSQGGHGARELTSTFIGEASQTLGPHGSTTLATSAFMSNGSPFTLQNITHVHLTPNAFTTTRSTTWISRPSTTSHNPEMPSGVVWACLAAVGGLVAKWRGSIG